MGKLRCGDCTAVLQGFFLLTSLGYYAALCVVCGVHRRRLAFGFALSMSVLTLLCLLLHIGVWWADEMSCDESTERRGSRQTQFPRLSDDEAAEEATGARSGSLERHNSDDTLADAIITQRPGEATRSRLATGKSQTGSAESSNPLCHTAATEQGQRGATVAAGGDDVCASCRFDNSGTPPSTPPTAGHGVPGLVRMSAAMAVHTVAQPVNRGRTASSRTCSFVFSQLSLGLTIAVTIFCLASGFVIFYDTHCLFNVLPVLCGPLWWGGALRPVFRCYSHHDGAPLEYSRRCAASKIVLRILAHRATVAAICLIAIIIYVAAIVTNFVHFRPEDTSTASATPSRAVKIVSSLSALPLVFVGYLYVAELSFSAPVSAARMGRWPASIRRDRGRRGRMTSQGTVCHACRVTPRLDATTHDAVAASSDGVRHGGIEARLHSMQTGSLHADCGDDTLTTITNDECTDSFATTRSVGDSALAQSSLIMQLGGSRAVSTTNSHSDGTSLAASPFVARALPSLTTSMMPQTRTLTMLYLTYRGVDTLKPGAADSELGGGERRPHLHKNRGLLQPAVVANYQDLIELVQEAMQDKEGAPLDWSSVVLTTHDDTLCLVWGLLPCVADLVLLAVRTAEYLLSLAQRRPPSALLSRHSLGLTASGEAKLPLARRLVTAVVYAPHSPLSVIGSSAFRSVHFFRPDQHAIGMMLLRRGELLYQRMPCLALGDTSNEHSSAFRGIMLDSRAAFNAAQSVLSRPCGIACEAQGVGLARSVRSGIVASVPTYQIMYDFVRFITVKEDEWHLMVQYRAQLSRHFAYLDTAAQLLQQGNRDGALKTLQDALQDEANYCDRNSITLATIMSEDLQKVKVT